MVIFASLITNLILPLDLSLITSIFAFLGMLALIAIIIGIVEAGIARLRMSHIFEFVFVMSSFALVIASLAAVKIYGV